MQRSYKSIRRYRTDYKRFIDVTDFGSKDIADINEIDITKLLIMNANGSKYGADAKYHELKIKAVLNFAGNIRQAFKYAYTNRRINYNPMNYVGMNLIKQQCDRTEKPDDEKIFSDDELERLKEEFHRLQEEKPDYLIPYACEFKMMTGARVGEVSGLKWKVVNFSKEKDKSYIKFQTADVLKKDMDGNLFYSTLNRTKTGKTRYFGIFEELRDLLYRVRDIQYKNDCPNEYVFSNKYGKLSPGSIAKVFRHACERTGAEIGSIHAMRKTVSSRLLTMGFPPVAVANMLGHTLQVNATHYAFDMTNEVQKLNRFRSQYNSQLNKCDDIKEVTKKSSDENSKMMQEMIKTNQELQQKVIEILSKAN